MTLTIYQQAEEWMAREMPAIAAAENKAMRQVLHGNQQRAHKKSGKGNAERRQERMEKALEFIRQKKGATRGDLQQHLTLGESAVDQYVRELRRQGLVEMVNTQGVSVYVPVMEGEG